MKLEGKRPQPGRQRGGRKSWGKRKKDQGNRSERETDVLGPKQNGPVEKFCSEIICQQRRAGSGAVAGKEAHALFIVDSDGVVQSSAGERKNLG